MRLPFNLLNSFFNFLFFLIIIQLFASCAYFSARKSADDQNPSSKLAVYKTLHVFYCSDYKGNFVNIHYPKYEQTDLSPQMQQNLNFEFVYQNENQAPMKHALEQLKKEQTDRKITSLIDDIEQEKSNSYWCDCYPIAKPSITKDTFVLDSRLYSFLSDQDKQVLVNDLKQTKKNLVSNIKECQGHMETHAEKVKNRYKKVENNLFVSETALLEH